MKAFIAAVVFATIAAIGASMLLNSQQRGADVAFTTSGARVGDAGKNLIGG